MITHTCVPCFHHSAPQELTVRAKLWEKWWVLGRRDVITVRQLRSKFVFGLAKTFFSPSFFYHDLFFSCTLNFLLLLLLYIQRENLCFVRIISSCKVNFAGMEKILKIFYYMMKHDWKIPSFLSCKQLESWRNICGMTGNKAIRWKVTSSSQVSKDNSAVFLFSCGFFHVRTTKPVWKGQENSFSFHRI